MNLYYKDKMEFHFKEYQLSVDSNKEKSSQHHMKEYLNYQAMYERTKENG